MLCSQRLLNRHVVRSVNVSFQALYSGKRNSDNDQDGPDVYNVVSSSPETEIGINNPNWELFSQRYRLYMPGKLGHAWVDNSSTAHFDYSRPFQSLREGSMEYSAQECPLLLRLGLMEMFPGLNFRQQNTTIVTLRQPLYRRGRRQDVDELTKLFLVAAQKICGQLMDVGYWADFINPFSGRPYYNSVPRDVLFKTDKRFHCLGFNVESKAACKVISVTQGSNRYMVGSLYTSAPPQEAIAPIVKEAEGEKWLSEFYTTKAGLTLTVFLVLIQSHFEMKQEGGHFPIKILKSLPTDATLLSNSRQVFFLT